MPRIHGKVLRKTFCSLRPVGIPGTCWPRLDRRHQLEQPAVGFPIFSLISFINLVQSRNIAVTMGTRFSPGHNVTIAASANDQLVWAQSREWLALLTLSWRLRFFAGRICTRGLLPASGIELDKLPSAVAAVSTLHSSGEFGSGSSVRAFQYQFEETVIERLSRRWFYLHNSLAQSLPR